MRLNSPHGEPPDDVEITQQKGDGVKWGKRPYA